MPMYNLLCPHCGKEKEEFATYTTFCEHNASDKPVECPNCKEIAAFYSLTHLKQNLQFKESNVLNFYESSTQEKWLRGFGDLGKR